MDLKSKVAINITINIIDAFVYMRKYISNNLLEQKYINNMVIKHEYDIKLLHQSFSKFEDKKKINEIYFKGQIYEIRGEYVMLDSDLAKIYDVETKRINEAVKRNILKFPYNYSFVLTNEESKSFLVANCDQKIETRGGKYKNSRVCTEQGVWMLSTVLKSKVAIEANIKLIDAFVKLRKYVSNTLIEQSHINKMVIKDNERNKLRKYFTSTVFEIRK